MLNEIKKDENNPRNSIYECVCGTVKSIRRSAVKSNSTKSCGCHRRKIAIENGKTVTTHGMSNTPIYSLWQSLEFKSDWDTFEQFHQELGSGYLPGLTLIKNNGYFWVSSLESKKNKSKKACLDKFGVEFAFQDPKVQEKIKKTLIDRYGVDHPSKSNTILQKSRKTCLEKYGSTHYSSSEIGRQRLNKKNSHYFEGETTEYWAKEIGISRTYFGQLVKRTGFDETKRFVKSGPTYIENSIVNILDSLQINYIKEFKIENRYADFYIPSFNLIIEANGNYWHSDAVNKDQNYHFNKKRLYDIFGYKSLFFREDEIMDKLEIVKSIIMNKLRLSNRTGARKTKLTTINKDLAKKFLNENHLMGNGKGSNICLEIDGEILCIMQYTKNKKGVVDISRFCNLLGASIVGGFSKILKHLEDVENPSKIVNFTDLRYGEGSHLEGFGFTKKSCYKSFCWTKNYKCFHRMKFMGSSGYELGYYKIWDCGQLKYEKTYKIK